MAFASSRIESTVKIDSNIQGQKKKKKKTLPIRFQNEQVIPDKKKNCRNLLGSPIISSETEQKQNSSRTRKDMGQRL